MHIRGGVVLLSGLLGQLTASLEYFDYKLFIVELIEGVSLLPCPAEGFYP